jgi:hypothetical protein
MSGPIDPEVTLDELLRQHEARQALAARAAYSLLRISAAVPPDSRFVGAAASAGQRATAWLSASATNPGRWVSRSVLVAELAELDGLLQELQERLESVVSWVTNNLATASSAARQGPPQPTIRVPRTLLAECNTLVADLATVLPAQAA